MTDSEMVAAVWAASNELNEIIVRAVRENGLRVDLELFTIRVVKDPENIPSVQLRVYKPL